MTEDRTANRLAGCRKPLLALTLAAAALCGLPLVPVIIGCTTDTQQQPPAPATTTYVPYQGAPPTVRPTITAGDGWHPGGR